MERFYKYGLTLLISSVAVLEFVQVMLRYVFQKPVMGLEEILLYPTLWLYFLGSVNASREDTQIKANVLDIFLKTEKSVMVVKAIADTLSLGICAWLTWWAWDYFRYALRIWKDSPTLYIPTFYAECSMFIGLAAMSCYIVHHLIKSIRQITAG
jgi:TRAP-type C4-dicarboxylate transport system permease small subunit